MVILAVLVAVGVWAAWVFDEAHRHMVQAQTELSYARGQVLADDPALAQEGVALAKAQTQAAADLTDMWVWKALAAVPKAGDSLRAARAVIFAADSSVNGLATMSAGISGIDQELSHNTFDLASLAVADEAMTDSEADFSRARAHLANAPRADQGAWVLPSLQSEVSRMEAQSDAMSSTAAVVQQLGDYAPALLGADNPQSYFVGVQVPNQMTAMGGVVDLWGVVRVDDGTVTVVDSGAGEDLRLSNTSSPDFPRVAQSWLDAYHAETGRRLDGALAVGLDAPRFGGEVTLANGATVPDAREFLVSGIYDMYPDTGQTRQRREAREAVAAQVVEAAFAADLPTLEPMVRDRRIMLWVRDPQIQQAIAATTLGHALQPAAAHTVEPVLINVDGSRLDRRIMRGVDYAVGRCPAPDGTVRSEVTMQYRIGIRRDALMPEAMIGAARVGPNGPISRMRLKVYLPAGAQPVAVLVGGEGHAWRQSEEAGRPVVSLSLALPPKAWRTVKVEFDEPDSPAPGTIEVQRMPQSAGVIVEDHPCELEQA